MAERCPWRTAGLRIQCAKAADHPFGQHAWGLWAEKKYAHEIAQGGEGNG